MTAALHLHSSRLQIEIAPPATISGARWNRGAYITQVTLDNRHIFCGREPDGGSDGVGLCGEFGLFAPVGYDEAAPGQRFPKLGVGLLQKIDARPYNFTRPYPIEPFPWQIERAPDALQFECLPLPCRGYAARLRHTLSAHENLLILETELENGGERKLETREYRHNFLCIDGAGPGPRLALETSFPLEPLDDEAAPAIPFRLEAAPDEPLMRFFAGAPGESWWEVRHENGVRVREIVDAPLAAFHLWGAPGVLSPEAFVAVEVSPGQTQRWRRTYRFDHD